MAVSEYSQLMIRPTLKKTMKSRNSLPVFPNLFAKKPQLLPVLLPPSSLPKRSLGLNVLPPLLKNLFRRLRLRLPLRHLSPILASSFMLYATISNKASAHHQTIAELPLLSHPKAPRKGSKARRWFPPKWLRFCLVRHDLIR